MAKLKVNTTSKVVETIVKKTIKERVFVLTLNETEAEIVQNLTGHVICEKGLDVNQCYRKETDSIYYALYHEIGLLKSDDYFEINNFPLVAKRRKVGEANG